MNKGIMSVIILSAVLVLFSCCSDSSGSILTNRTDWEKLHFSEYYICNCIWNKGSITGYDQYVYLTADGNFPLGWYFDWPDGIREDDVKTYPSIHFGKSPWDTSSTTVHLPAAVGDIEEFFVEYDLDENITPGSRYNLSFDIWITEGPGTTSPPEDNVIREIMIWIDCSENVFGSGTPVTVGGRDYLYVRYPDSTTGTYTRDYMAFLRSPGPGTMTDTIDIREFLDYLLDQGHLLDRDYISLISLGNEVWHGSGSVDFRNFEVTVR